MGDDSVSKIHRIRLLSYPQGLFTRVEESGIIIPGSTANSDLSASVAFIKNKLRAKLQANQKTGRVTEW